MTTTTRAWRGHVFIATSLDGFIARHDGDIEWLTNPPSNPNHAPGHDGPNPPPDYETFMSTVDHVVMGRGTYEKILTFDSWPYAKQVIILSTTLPPDENKRVTVTRDIARTVQLLAERDARGVYVDGGKVIQGFLEHDLIDEITLAHAPVLLGHGIPLFGTLARDIRLTHTGTIYTDSGMTSSHYAVLRE
jgi:dihydrofolate reductase